MIHIHTFKSHLRHALCDQTRRPVAPAISESFSLKKSALEIFLLTLSIHFVRIKYVLRSPLSWSDLLEGLGDFGITSFL